jgi:hypothetical protein
MAEARAAAEAIAILPLDYMLAVMRDANTEPKRRDAMAMAAAPYLHPKMSPVEAKANEPERSEPTEIRVTFVRPRPRPEDHENSETSRFPCPLNGCLLSGVKRTSQVDRVMSACDPSRTS